MAFFTVSWADHAPAQLFRSSFPTDNAFIAPIGLDLPRTGRLDENSQSSGPFLDQSIQFDTLSAPAPFTTASPRQSKQSNDLQLPINAIADVPANAGIDFSQAKRTADGRLCVIKETNVETLAKDPILECIHKNVEKCHYTYVTQFTPAQEEGKYVEVELERISDFGS